MPGVLHSFGLPDRLEVDVCVKGDRNSRENIRGVEFMAKLVACVDAYRSLGEALLRLQRGMEIGLKLDDICIGNHGDIGLLCRLHSRERCRSASYSQQAKGGLDLHCSRSIQFEAPGYPIK